MFKFLPKLKILTPVQPHWDKYFQVKRDGKPTSALFALNWAQYPKVQYVDTEKNDILDDSIQNLTLKKLYKKTMIQKWRASKLLLKNRYVYKQISEAAITTLLEKYSIFLFKIFNNINEVTLYEQIRGCALQSPCSENFIKALKWVPFFELLMCF